MYQFSAVAVWRVFAGNREKCFNSKFSIPFPVAAAAVAAVAASRSWTLETRMMVL